MNGLRVFSRLASIVVFLAACIHLVVRPGDSAYTIALVLMAMFFQDMEGKT